MKQIGKLAFAVTLLITFWNVIAFSQEWKRPKYTLWGHDSWVTDVAFSPDGKLIASASHDTTIRLWSVGDRTEIAKLEGHFFAVNSIAFSPDGKLLASGGSDRTVRIWSIEDQKEIAKVDAHKYGVEAVAFSPDGKFIASGSKDYRIRIWSVEDLKRIATIPRQQNIIQSLAYSPDGKTLASGSIDLKLWETENYDEIAVLEDQSRWFWAIQFSPDGNRIATGNSDRSIQIWSAEEHAEIITLGGHSSDVSSVAFSPNGQILASASRELKLWSMSALTEIETLELEDDYLHSIDFSPDGTMIVGGTNNTEILIWDVRPFVTPTIVTAVVTEADFEKVIVDLRIEQTLGSYGYELDLEFDPNILEAISVSEGSFLRDKTGWAGRDETYFQSGQIDNENGLITGVLCTRLIAGEVVGDGTIATVIFQPKKTDDSKIEFPSLKMSNSDGDAIIAYPVANTIEIPVRISAEVALLISIDGPYVSAEISLKKPINVEGFSVDLTFPKNLELIATEDQYVIIDNTIHNITKPTTFKFKIYESGDLNFSLTNGYLKGPLKTSDEPILVWNSLTVVASPNWDINRDYVIDVFDLVLLGDNFRNVIDRDPRPNPDVNRDGIVDIYDFVKVGSHFGMGYAPIAEIAATASAIARNFENGDLKIDRSLFRQIATEIANHKNFDDPEFSQTYNLILDLLQDRQPPKRDRLLPNFPNPFNPETWIPFEITESTDLKLTIYNSHGEIVKTIEFQQLPAGFYTDRRNAIYWNGKNDHGEDLPSGVYFYEIKTDHLNKTRKMILLK